MEVYLSLDILAAIICAYIASHKGRSAVLWFFLGLIGHLLAVIVVLLLPSVDD